MADTFEKQREELEQKVIDAAIDLCAFMGSAGFAAMARNTHPPLYIAFGEKEIILKFMNSDLENAGEQE